ncbi:TetR family transcriptional regulator [Rhodococcus sp. D2-41]|uniref:TetR family transcriptional regulator n=1 Tax=Speluncibacter jeojiensis TaxID=2710754 RepID=A0A9X4RFB1_9ACTN|nr:TetR/AcrR family transcriptional regulator [Rhodococcus sp. D2-41]MDG3009518.1 TetR family transcriptional regulator [Rhodococcus sp. D2-41]MDG3016448.1 TetR family transcriptional regulator [Corynebacteriales bacterium D3-21]
MPSSEDARGALIDVAERLFAERGIDGVSMRDVAAAAGQRNNSAVAYHFGGRDGLVLAVLRRRMGEINTARRALLADVDARGRGNEVRALVEVALVPLADYVRSTEEVSHYAQFLARVAPAVDFSTGGFADVSDANAEVLARLTRVLDHLDRRTAVERIDLMFSMAVAALAVFEQRKTAGIPVVAASFDQTVAHVLDMSVGALLAPESRRGPTPPSC